MIGFLKRKIAAAALKSFVRSLARSKDRQTSAVSALAAIILEIRGLDWDKLISGDPYQIAHLVACAAIWYIGRLATKPQADGKATFAGVVGGALYAVAGSVEAITTAVTIALVGYLSGKPVAPNPQFELPGNEGDDDH